MLISQYLSVTLISLTFVLQYLASVGGCLKRLNSFAEGDSFYFYPQIIPKSPHFLGFYDKNITCFDVKNGQKE